ncbi:MAG: AraC family transcriptional regulator [Ferruginibacter sp.]
MSKTYLNGSVFLSTCVKMISGFHMIIKVAGEFRWVGGKDYPYLRSLFLEVEKITIEKYIINQKIEKVKALIIYDQLSLSVIAFKLGYGNVSHLSNQFKKVTGLTPGHFKQVGQNK